MTQTPAPQSPLNRATLADAILTTALDCIIVADDQGRIVEFNPAAERTFGWTRDQVLHRPMEDTIVPHHHRAAHHHGMARYLAGGAPRVLGRRVEVEGLHSSGRVFPVELSITETEMDGHRFFVSTLRDLTQKRAAEDDLRQARASLQAIFDNVPAALYLRDRQDNLVMINDWGARFLGRDPAEMIGQPMSRFREAQNAEGVREADDKIARTGQPETREFTYHLPGGDRVGLMTFFPVSDGKGEVIQIGGMLIDVTDLHIARTELQQTRTLLETVFDNIPAELYLREIDGTLIMANQWSADFYGKGPDGLKGMLIWEFDQGEEIQIARLAQERLLETGQPVTQEYRQHITGRNVVILNTIFPVRDAEGQITRIGGFSMDVTELHNARREMQRAQETLQSFIEQVPVGIHINRLGPGGIEDQTVEFVNENICKPYGLKLDKVVGRDPYSVFRNDLVVRIQKDLDRKILKTRRPANIEMMNPYSKRHERYTRFPILSPDGTVTHIGGTHVDVDDTVRAKAELDEARALLESIFDNVPAVLYLRELDGRFISINKWGAEVLGVEEASKAIGVNAESLDSEEERAVAAKAQAQLLATGQPVTQEYRRVVNGRDIVVLNSIFPVRDASGHITRIGGFATDVTELYQARNALLDAQNLLQTIFDNVPAELYLRRLDGGYIMANQWALNFYGLTEADLPNLTAETFDTGEGTEVSRQAQRELLATGQPVTREFSHKARGRDVVILNTIFPLRNTEGEIDRIGGVSTDITELHNARNQLRQAQESLHQSEKLAALGQLLAGVAHELNNPLAVVLGRAAILLEKLAGTPHEAPLQKLREAANRCARIVKTFLAMARQTGPRRQLVEVNDLIESALEMTTYGLRSADILWTAAPLAESHKIEVDQDQIVQVLINLVLNAQHALQGQEGARRIEIRSDLSPDRRWLHITVADNGPGIPPSIAHRIFDPFFTTKPVGQGTGLGLSVCKSIVEAHGGKLDLEQSPGGGATFRISLPTLSTGLTEAEDTLPGSAPLRRGRFLVVDDEVEIAAILADCLSPLGIECVIATDGRSGLQRVEEMRFDAVFCDVNMPGMGGIAFYHQLRELDPRLARHLVFISGDVLHRDWDRMNAAVDRPTIEKPFDPQLVRETALQLLSPEGTPS